ncbi:MAG: hypothetical protein DLM73_06380 [Chthoniobacterales bacterium]|nr:MAG: hypothetical protein DLM73_06380 [Chthoniobacterales bacterium]
MFSLSSASPRPHAPKPRRDQIKAAGAIPLTTELLDKFVKSVTADEAAKAELAATGKDPSITPGT